MKSYLKTPMILLLKLGLVLSLILFVKPTSALDPAILKLDERIIFKGEKAAFDGVLVPENNYRWYQGEVESCEAMQTAIKEPCVADYDSDFALNFLGMSITFSLGVVFGYIIFKPRP